MFLRNNMKTGLILLSALILNLINFNIFVMDSKISISKMKNVVDEFVVYS